ncbi:MAG: hypothetical protein MJ083_00645 [Clostridia bacterium]|nr:hypothetical protein [Clostridia bacterium]
MKKSVSIILCVALMVSVLFVLPASAATNSNKNVVRPAQYTSVGPNDSGAQIVYRETFDGASSPESVGYFPGYLDYGDQPAYFMPACKLSLVGGHSGKGLKISDRDQIYGKKSKSGKISPLDHAGGEFSFVVTNNYPKKGAAAESSYVDKAQNFITANEQVANTGGGKDIGAIINKYVSNVKDKQEVSLFFSMWVYTDTAQTFLPKIQYMGTNELWIPADDYWEVPAKKWTQVGAIVDNGKTYYCSLVGEGGSEAYGAYGSMPATTESKFCMATKSKDASGNVTFTNGDYIIDDVTIWKVSDKAKLYDMQYTMLDKKVFTGLDGLVQIDNKDNIASKKVVNAFNVPKPTTKKAVTPTKKPVATKAPTTSVKVVKETNKAGQVIGTKKVVVTEAAATATGTGTETGTATGTGTGTEATVTATATETVVNTAAETTATNANGEPTEPEEKGSLLWLWILLGVVVVGGGTGAGIALSKKKGAPAEEAAEEAPAEETPSDDAE